MSTTASDHHRFDGRGEHPGVGLGLAKLHQEVGDLGAAIDVVEQLEPTTFAALSLAELYSQADRHQEVVELTEGISNEDDVTALLCVFRGVAFRETDYFGAARESFKEALKSKKRAPVVRHRALLERSRTYEAEGKRAMARKDLETDHGRGFHERRPRGSTVGSRRVRIAAGVTPEAAIDRIFTPATLVGDVRKPR